MLQATRTFVQGRCRYDHAWRDGVVGGAGVAVTGGGGVVEDAAGESKGLCSPFGLMALGGAQGRPSKRCDALPKYIAPQLRYFTDRYACDLLATQAAITGIFIKLNLLSSVQVRPERQKYRRSHNHRDVAL